MTRAPRPSDPDDATFEPDEQPTRPAPPPEEHLRRLRRSVWPARARPGARRRPPLSPTTETWLAQQGSPHPRTATSRFRAVAAAVLGGGSGRASRLDPVEIAPVTAPPSTPAQPDPPSPGSLTATVRMPAHVARPVAPTLKLQARAAPPSGAPSSSTGGATAAFDFGQPRRRLVRRAVVSCAVLLFCGWTAWFVLHAPPAMPPAPHPVSPPAATAAIGVDPATASDEGRPPPAAAEPAPSHDHAAPTGPKRHVRSPFGPGRASSVF